MPDVADVESEITGFGFELTGRRPSSPPLQPVIGISTRSGQHTRGWSLNDGEGFDGTRAVGAAIRRADGLLIASDSQL